MTRPAWTTRRGTADYADQAPRGAAWAAGLAYALDFARAINGTE